MIISPFHRNPPSFALSHCTRVALSPCRLWSCCAEDPTHLPWHGLRIELRSSLCTACSNLPARAKAASSPIGSNPVATAKIQSWPSLGVVIPLLNLYGRMDLTSDLDGSTLDIPAKSLTPFHATTGTLIELFPLAWPVRKEGDRSHYSYRRDRLLAQRLGH